MLLCKGMGLGSLPALRRTASAGDTDLSAGLLFEERGDEGCRLVTGCSGPRGCGARVDLQAMEDKLPHANWGRPAPQRHWIHALIIPFSEDGGIYIDCQTSPGILKGQKDGQAALVEHERNKDGMEALPNSPPLGGLDADDAAPPGAAAPEVSSMLPISLGQKILSTCVPPKGT